MREGRGGGEGGWGSTCQFWFVLCADQLFSRIADYLHKHDAHDRDGILAAIEDGFHGLHYKEKPYVSNLDRAANISDWLEPYIGPTPHLTEFRQFKLQKMNGKVTVSARSRCGDESEFNQWQDLNKNVGESTPVHIMCVQYVICMNINEMLCL